MFNNHLLINLFNINLQSWIIRRHYFSCEFEHLKIKMIIPPWDRLLGPLIEHTRSRKQVDETRFYLVTSSLARRWVLQLISPDCPINLHGHRIVWPKKGSPVSTGRSLRSPRHFRVQAGRLFFFNALANSKLAFRF